MTDEKTRILKVYRTKELTNDKQRIYFAARLNGATPIEAATLAKYNSPARNAHRIESSRRMKHMLNKHADKFIRVPTKEWKMERLVEVVEATIPEGLKNQEVIDANVVGKGISAIAELNKVQGHYAPTQSQSINVSIEADADQAKSLFDKLLTHSTLDH